jgi:hypothetical protein
MYTQTIIANQKPSKLELVGVIVGILLASLGCSAASAQGQSPFGGFLPVTPTSYVVHGAGDSNAEKAHAQLQNTDLKTFLILVSGDSTGLEGEIYRDLIKRNFRSTTGPDEGVDTHGYFCYPNCVFVLKEAANVLSVEGWTAVLRHEYRHVVQATNNPNMAQDFREPGGRFTSYAAFSEACADYGLNTAPVYQAETRMGQLSAVLGPDQQGLIDQACSGSKPAYDQVVAEYDHRQGSDQAFAELFPPYY